MKALIVHTGGGLGDVLLARPVIDTLAQAGYDVDFLARQATSAALSGHPHLHELIVIPSKDPPHFTDMWRWARRLRRQNYRVALLLWGTSRWAWTLRFAGIPLRVGQDSRLTYSFTFTHRVHVRSEHGDETSHWTDILLDYPRALGLTPAPPQVHFPVQECDVRQAQAYLHAFSFQNQTGPLIGFHSGKGLPLGPERWPVAHFAHIANDLQQRLGARLVLTGGPSEGPLVQAIVDRLHAPALNLAGQTSLPVLAALYSICDVTVCPDSGPMHLAAAVGCPVVGIYALDEDFPQRWAPFGVPHRVVRPPRPACHANCLKATCQDFACYLKVQPQAVSLAVAELLQPVPDKESPLLEGNGHAS